MRRWNGVTAAMVFAPVGIAAWLGVFAVGCKTVDTIRDLIPEPEPPADVVPALPVNPDTPPDLPGSISEQWSISRKTYDQTWRVRWPSAFAAMGIGPGSYCTANGNRADFRSFDVDHGSKRPSYTMPLSIPLANPVRCILYSADGTAVGWFDGAINSTGRLPK